MPDAAWFVIALALFGASVVGPPAMTGRATWYCDPYVGRLTQSGEVYTAQELTTAVPVELWPQLQGRHIMACTVDRCVLVRANDTGFLTAWNVLLDLSPPAFRQLAPLGQGVVDVNVWVY